MDLEKIKSFFLADKFARSIGIDIDSIGEGEAVCSLTLTQDHYNAGGGVQGGVMFTIADFAFAVAANALGNLTVTLTSSVSFIRGTRGKTLYAHARQKSATKRVCFYEVEVTDDLGVTVADVNITGYIKDDVINF